MVAIVVVNWNGKKVTLECLASLQQLTTPDVRIVLVDNGSSDGSAEAIRETFPGVDVLALASNRRFAGGNNAGIAHALAMGADHVMLIPIVDPDVCTGCELCTQMKARAPGMLSVMPWVAVNGLKAVLGTVGSLSVSI